MMFASFQEWLGNHLLMACALLGLGGWVVKRFLNNNPEIKDEAKKAATGTAIRIIRGYFNK